MTEYINGVAVVDGVGVLDEIVDADGDTKIQVEEAGDEDKIRMDVAGTEAFLLNNVGILDLAKQSRAKIYLSASQQVIPTNANTKVALDTEVYDEQNEFDTTLSSGTATATTANKLEDSAATFIADGIIVGAWVWNTTDNTYASVTAIDSETVLSISVDIMADTEAYKVFNARFTAAVAGYYAIVGSSIFLSTPADKLYRVTIWKNGSTLTYSDQHSSFVDNLGMQNVIVNYLAASDYIELFVFHTSGVNKNIFNAERGTFFSIHKLS